MTEAVAGSIDVAAAARFFRVLGDPTRLRVLGLLADRERTVSDLVSALGQPQPRVSTHLACLRHCGFVATERKGREIVYRLALEGLAEVLGSSASVMAPLADQLATCTRIGPAWI